MKKGDVVSVITLGGEYVGKLVEIDNEKRGSVSLEDPRMVVMSEKGMGFARGLAATGEENPTEVTIQSYMMMIPTNEEVVKVYRKATSGLVTL